MKRSVLCILSVRHYPETRSLIAIAQNLNLIVGRLQRRLAEMDRSPEHLRALM